MRARCRGTDVAAAAVEAVGDGGCMGKIVMTQARAAVVAAASAAAAAACCAPSMRNPVVWRMVAQWCGECLTVVVVSPGCNVRGTCNGATTAAGCVAQSILERTGGQEGARQEGTLDIVLQLQTSLSSLQFSLAVHLSMRRGKGCDVQTGIIHFNILR